MEGGRKERRGGRRDKEEERGIEGARREGRKRKIVLRGLMVRKKEG